MYKTIKTMVEFLKKEVEKNRPYLYGVFVKKYDNADYFCATDGRALFMWKIPEEKQGVFPENAILPITPEMMKLKPELLFSLEPKDKEHFVINGLEVTYTENCTPPNIESILNIGKRQENYSIYDPKYMTYADKFCPQFYIEHPLCTGPYNPSIWIKDDKIVVLMPIRVRQTEVNI